MLGVNHLIGFGAGGDSYAIEHSCDFNGSGDYLYRTLSAGDDPKAFTFAAWTKRSSTGSNSWIMSASGDDWIGYTSDRLGINVGPANARILTTATYGSGTWRHVVIAYDSANATAGDRMRMWIDGAEVSSFSTDTNPSLNYSSIWNTAAQHNIGKLRGASQYYNGLLADVHFIDGFALGADSFLSSGVPKRYTGAFGSNGFRLDFANSGSLGTDVSGNGNNFTISGTPAQSADVPT